jgi:hypothetical protein
MGVWEFLDRNIITVIVGIQLFGLFVVLPIVLVLTKP